ncbi:MAG: DUF433 domain-containing protein [Deltaproteobacteria bacterium]|nr:DUF433 domain-containing protein [Deltaproteobacteria bacterium]
MASVQKSMRIPEEMVREIQGIAQQSGKDFSTITKELLEEAIKMHRCPGIVFTEGVSARRARIAGTGIEVWEVIANYKSVGEDFERLHLIYHWLTELQLRAALGYYRAYPKEIDHLMTQNENWTKESIHKRYPFLAGSRG